MGLCKARRKYRVGSPQKPIASFVRIRYNRNSKFSLQREEFFLSAVFPSYLLPLPSV